LHGRYSLRNRAIQCISTAAHLFLVSRSKMYEAMRDEIAGSKREPG
jgi:hypothetical protein